MVDRHFSVASLWNSSGRILDNRVLKRDICHEYFPSLIKFTQMANLSIPWGEIAPVGNNFLANLAKIITISQYAPRSTDTFQVHLCAR